MTTRTNPNSHFHAFNYHTGHPRFHFDENAGAGAAAGGAAAGAAGAAAGAATAWHTGVEPEVLGFWQNKGLPLDDPKNFGLKLTELYRGAEKFIGAPPDQLIRMPKPDAKPEEFRAYYERLGAPKEAKDYDLTAVTDPVIADSLRAIMHERGVAKDAASAIASSFAKALETKAATQTTLDAGKLAEERLALEKNWGGKESSTYQYNHLQAMEGARRLGITPEAVKALENQIGYAGVMDAMRKIGAVRREDIFVQTPGGQGPNGQVTTREGAIARKSELMADKAWAARWTSGDVMAKREYDQLNQMINGEA